MQRQCCLKLERQNVTTFRMYIHEQTATFSCHYFVTNTVIIVMIIVQYYSQNKLLPQARVPNRAVFVLLLCNWYSCYSLGQILYYYQSHTSVIVQLGQQQYSYMYSYDQIALSIALAILVQVRVLITALIVHASSMIIYTNYCALPRSLMREPVQATVVHGNNLYIQEQRSHRYR